MIFDNEVMFANELDVAGSPNDIDLEQARRGYGKPIEIAVQVDEGVTGMTGLSLQDSDDGSAFDALVTWTGDLAGKNQTFRVPADARRYLRLNLAGTVAGGNWTAGVVLEGAQSNN